jgi:hypothetical protein
LAGDTDKNNNRGVFKTGGAGTKLPSYDLDWREYKRIFKFLQRAFWSTMEAVSKLSIPAWDAKPNHTKGD